MGQRRQLIAGAFVLLTSISSPSAANDIADQQETVANELMEAFIGLRVGQGGSSFYRVMVDYDETPYIAVNSFLSEWLGLNPECDIQRRFCSVILPGEDIPRWIDGQNLRMSDAETGEEIDLSPEQFVLKDEMLWIDFEALEQWLPLRAVWSLNAYQMSINAYFTLPKDRMKQREQKRQREREEKAERIRKSGRNEIRVPEEGNQFYEARGEVSASVDSKGEHRTALSYDVGADLYQGRFQAGGNLSDSKSKAIQYWQYERFDNPTGDYLALGQVFFDGNLLDQSRVLKDGYRFARHYQNEGSGEFILNATVPEEAVVDVYKNGFYEKTVIADKLGQIVLTDIQAGSGDIITLRSITKEGAESEQRFKIAGSSSQYLDAHDWDYQLVGGNDDKGDIHSLSAQYGLASHLTTGLTIKHENLDDESQDNVLGTLAFRPHHQVSLQWEQDLTEGHWAYSTDVSLWVTHDLRFFGQDMKKNSDGGFNSLPNEFHGVEHLWGSPRLQVQSRFIQSDEENRFRERLGIKLKNRWDMRVEAERTWYKETDVVRDDWEVRHIYSLSGGSKLEGGIGGSDDDIRWFGSLRWLGETQSPWSNKVTRNRYSLDASIQGGSGQIEPAVGLTWYHNDSLSGSIRGTKEELSATIKWKFGVARKSYRHDEQWHKQSWDYFRQGTIKGRLMSPPTGEKSSEPLPDTRLWVSNYPVRTDENGYFIVEGLPVNQTVPVHVDMETLSIDMMPASKRWDVNIRAGTVLSFNPPMIWSVGVDGFVSERLMSPGLSLVFEHEKLGELADIQVEEDGFFIAERLAPGEYVVRLEYPDRESRSVKLIVDANETWISDVQILASEVRDNLNP